LRRVALIALLVAAVAAGPARAQTPPPPGEPRIAAGVTIARIDVGGLTEGEARAAVEAVFRERLLFAFRTRTWGVRPATLGSYPYLGRSLAVALAAQPGTAVKMKVKLHTGKVRRYAAYLDRRLSRAPVSSKLLLRSLRPYLTRARVGFDVNRAALERAIVRALLRTERGTPIRVAFTTLAPAVTRNTFGPTIVIRRESRRLYLYRNTSLVRVFRIAVGTAQYPTPLGRYSVISKERNPTWDPPSSPWAAGLGPVPPGPSNPLGTRWIGTSAPAIGIHGTPQPWTVGTQASHGCIRMYMREVEWLFERVRVGTPVFMVRA
jgi:hypothetical protein